MAQMTLENAIPVEGGGSSLTVGINHLPMESWAIVDGTYGKQLEVNFKDGTQVKKAWIPFQQKFAPNIVNNFLGKLKSYSNFLACFIGAEAAEAHYDECYKAVRVTGFDNEDTESVQAFEEAFLVKLFSKVPAESDVLIPVILHYNAKGYLGIPYYKENNFRMMFGLNVVMGPKLTLDKPEDGTQESPETPVVNETDLPLVDAQGADLPF